MNGAACTITTYDIGGRTYQRIPFAAFDWAPEIVDCDDCGIHIGGLHHPLCIGCGCREDNSTPRR